MVSWHNSEGAWKYSRHPLILGPPLEKFYYRKGAILLVNTEEPGRLSSLYCSPVFSAPSSRSMVFGQACWNEKSTTQCCVLQPDNFDQHRYLSANLQAKESDRLCRPLLYLLFQPVGGEHLLHHGHLVFHDIPHSKLIVPGIIFVLGQLIHEI